MKRSSACYHNRLTGTHKSVDMPHLHVERALTHLLRAKLQLNAYTPYCFPYVSCPQHLRNMAVIFTASKLF